MVLKVKKLDPRILPTYDQKFMQKESLSEPALKEDLGEEKILRGIQIKDIKQKVTDDNLNNTHRALVNSQEGSCQPAH